MEYLSLANYVNRLNSNDFIDITNQIYEVSHPITSYYPKHKEWYFNKQLPGVLKGTRNILFVKDQNKVIAVAFLKKDEEERKLCGIYVSEGYRGQGIARNLIKESLVYLETDKPFLTIPETKVKLFESFITKYNWNLTEIVNGIYTNNNREYCYNGIIEKELPKIKIHP